MKYNFLNTQGLTILGFESIDDGHYAAEYKEI